MVDNNICVRIEAKKINLRRKLEDIVRSSEGLQIKSSDDASQPDLLIFELGGDIENDFQFVQSLLDSDAVGEVFLTSENTSPEILLQAIKTGAKEFFALPLQEKDVREALKKFKGRQRKANSTVPIKSGQIIDVVGSKGGVGSTTVAVNMAVSLASKDKSRSVALVDMNMLFGEIPLFLSIEPKYHWGEIAENIDRLDATFLMNILSRHSSGVYVLPSPGYLNKQPEVTPDIMEHLLNLMQRMFDVVVVDCGQSLTQASLKSMEMSNQVLLVSLLSLPCLANANKLLSSLENLGCLPRESLRVVINRYAKNSIISLEDAEKSINNNIFWTIPNDYQATVSAINQGRPLLQVASNAQITRNMEQLAEALMPSEEKPARKRWWFFGK